MFSFVKVYRIVMELAAYFCASDLLWVCSRSILTYHIYPYKRPLPINTHTHTPSSPPFHNSYFGVLHPTQQPAALRFWDSEKKMRFSTSPIEDRLREINKITAKHGCSDHRH